MFEMIFAALYMLSSFTNPSLVNLEKNGERGEWEQTNLL